MKKSIKQKGSKHQSLARRRFMDLQKARVDKYTGPWKRPDRRRQAFEVMKSRWRILRGYYRLQQKGFSKGMALEKITRLFGIGGSTLRNWEGQYKKNGKSGLIPKYQQPRSHPRTPFFVIQIIVLFRRLFHWGGHRIAAELAARDIFHISHMGVYKIFRRYRLYTRTYHPVGKRDGIRYKSYQAEMKNELWHLDFAGPFKEKKGKKWYLFLVIDDYSRFLIDLHLMDSLETAPMIEHLQQLFRTHGKPKAIMTDNATTFVSIWEEGVHQFQSFLKKRQIDHASIPPYYPQANGKAEAAVKITKKEAIRPFFKLKNKWKGEELQDLLDNFRWYYNAYRLHGGIGWKTPLQRFDTKLNIAPKGLRNLFFIGKVKLIFEFC